jgi:hypothetical protein
VTYVSRGAVAVSGPLRKPPEEDDLFEFETQLIVAWPAPGDPPPRTVRLPGLRLNCWPQRDGSVLYEIKYRNSPAEKRAKGRKLRDTAQMTVPWNRAGDDEKE